MAEDDNQRMVVLFGVAEAGMIGDIEYWLDVASRSRSISPDIQFVGFCAGAELVACHPLPAAQVTLLKSMDPLQTHALTTGARQRRAYIFQRLATSAGWCWVPADKKALAAQLAALFRQTIEKGGA